MAAQDIGNPLQGLITGLVAGGVVQQAEPAEIQAHEGALILPTGQLLIEHALEFATPEKAGQFIMGGGPGQLVIDLADHAIDTLVHQRAFILAIRHDDAFSHLPGQGLQLQFHHSHALVIHKDKAAETAGHPDQTNVLGFVRFFLVAKPVAGSQFLRPVDPALKTSLLPVGQFSGIRLLRFCHWHFNQFGAFLRTANQELLELVPDLRRRHVVAGNRGQTILDYPQQLGQINGAVRIISEG